MDTSGTDAIPTISRSFGDGTLVEALYQPEVATTSLAISGPECDAFQTNAFLAPTGERLVPYSPANNLLRSRCILLPATIGTLREKRDLVDEIQGFLHRYVDLPPASEALVAHYVLLTWVYDAFGELPYLRFQGSFGAGKTRALLAVGSLCYKPFFASGASTISPIFHVLDAFGGTLLLDEADFRFTDATAELTKILNNGNVRGLPVLRTMTNRHRELNPTAFRVFGPKIVAMRESFSDAALESRFVTIAMGARMLRADIPIHLPDSLAVEAAELRNALLAWRFAARASTAPNPERLIPTLSPRLNQTALALLSLVDDVDLRAEIAALLAGEETSRIDRLQSSDEARAIGALIGALKNGPIPCMPIAKVTDIFNETTENFHVPLSNKAVGALVRKLGIETIKSRGIYVVPQREFGKLGAVAARYGIAWDVSEAVVSDRQV